MFPSAFNFIVSAIKVILSGGEGEYRWLSHYETLSESNKGQRKLIHVCAEYKFIPKMWQNSSIVMRDPVVLKYETLLLKSVKSVCSQRSATDDINCFAAAIISRDSLLHCQTKNALYYCNEGPTYNKQFVWVGGGWN
jgi:hypothetical protein